MAEEIARGLQATATRRRATLRMVLNNLVGNAWKYRGKRDETIIEFGVPAVDRIIKPYGERV